MRVLIVDDSKAMRTIVMRTLRQAGMGAHTFVEAGNPAEAMGVLSAGPVDVVLSDWNMGEQSGLDLLKQINGTLQAKPVFGFVTTETTEELRNQAHAQGAQFFITKPFNVDTFSAALRRFLG